MSAPPSLAYQPCFSHKTVFPTVSMERNNTKAFGTDNEQPVFLRKAAARASKAFLRKTEGLPSPNAIGTLQTNGNVTLPLIHYWYSQKKFSHKNLTQTQYEFMLDI